MGSGNLGSLGQLGLEVEMDSTHHAQPHPSASVQFLSLSNPILQNAGSLIQRPGQVPTHSSKGSSF